MTDAVEYVNLAEDPSGPLPRRVSYGYVWGEALKEGIGGRNAFRSDLGAMYFAELGPDGRLEGVRMVVSTVRRFRVVRAADADVDWMARVLTHEGERLGTCVHRAPDGSLRLRWE